MTHKQFALLLLLIAAGCGGESARQVGFASADSPSPKAINGNAEKPTAEKPTAEKPTAEKPTAEKPTAEKPTAEKPTAEKPTVGNPSAEQPTAEKLPATSQPPATLHHVLAIADLTALQLPNDASRIETKPLTFSYSAPMTGGRTVKIALADLLAQLSRGGWSLTAAPQQFDEGAVAYLEQQDVWLVASLGVSKGFDLTTRQPSGQDLNVTAMVLGNVDVRNLPRPAVKEALSDNLSSVSYTTPLELPAVRKFHAVEFAKLGWRECIWQPLAGIILPMEEKEKAQGFFQNGMRLELVFNRQGQGTQVFLRPVVMQCDFPIPQDADDVELGDAPNYLFCSTKAPLAEAVALLRAGMEQRGWTASDLPPDPEKKIAAAVKFTAPDRDPLRAEFLESERSVFMQVAIDR